MDVAVVVLGAVAGVAVAVVAVAERSRRRLAGAVAAAMRRLHRGPQRGVPLADDLASAVDESQRRVDTLQREVDRLSGVIESLELGVMIVDDRGVVVSVNDVGQRYLGVKHGDVAEDRLQRVLDEVIVTRRAASQELDTYTPTRRVLRLRALPLEHGVESAGAVLYIEDFTEKRKLDAVRKDFITNVGHEMKTPLGAMALLAQTLQDTTDPNVRQKLADRLAIEANRMANLVSDLLDLSEAEALGAIPQPVPISDVVGDAWRQLESTAAGLGVTATIGDVPSAAVVGGDARQLTSAVANLIDNAIKYTSIKEGEGNRSIEVRTTVEGDSVVVEVEDSGIGIPLQHVDRIFERFYRVDRTAGRTSRNAGLGLSIVRHVALNHGGQVGVTSEEGKGSVFSLRLPRWNG